MLPRGGCPGPLPPPRFDNSRGGIAQSRPIPRVLAILGGELSGDSAPPAFWRLHGGRVFRIPQTLHFPVVLPYNANPRPTRPTPPTAMRDTPSDSLAALISARRTIHDFTAGRVPEQALIRDALEVARWAPNHYLTEPWRFYLPGAESVERICQLYAGLSQGNERAAKIKLARWRAMPGWLVVSCRRSEDARRAREDYAACCCVVQNLMLLLWEQGVGMKWSTDKLVGMAEFYAILGAEPEKEEVVGMFWYGYPATVPTTRRTALEACVQALP